jgi:glycine/D-amino acid oxidase-like deaminating enzyme
MADAGRDQLAGEMLDLPRSLWAATAIAAPPTAAAQGDRKADVAIIGAGYTGLSAALHLAERGLDVAVLEAAETGWGASGRNNGQVIPGMKLDPDEVEAHYGTETGGRLAKWAGDAPALVFDLIERHAIVCAPVRSGWIQPAYTRAAVRTIEARWSQWARRGADVHLIDAKDLPALLGTEAFFGAWLDRRGGSIQPLSYARGLAAAAIKAGARVFTRSMVVSMQRDAAGWTLKTPAASIQARHDVVATAAYATDLVPGLKRSFVPVRTAQVATRPLTPNVLKTILPGRQVASDTRRLLTSFRISPDGRLVMGGSGATGGPHLVSLEGWLHRAADELFGRLAKLNWDFGWSGYFAVTTDHAPHIHEPDPSLLIALGCNGRGIALSTAMGRLLAERILGRDARELEIPITRMRPVHFHAFRKIGIAAATAAKRAQDAADRRRS